MIKWVSRRNKRKATKNSILLTYLKGEGDPFISTGDKRNVNKANLNELTKKTKKRKIIFYYTFSVFFILTLFYLLYKSIYTIKKITKQHYFVLEQNKTKFYFVSYLLVTF
jgi:hypothetical protein